MIEIRQLRRARRRALTRRAWARVGGRRIWIVAAPVMALVAFVCVALTVYPPLYMIFGTDVPGLVNEAGDKGPVSTGEKLKALTIWVPWMLVLSAVAWRNARHRFSTPYLAVDPDGMWPVFGGRIQEGLKWRQIAAVRVVADGEPTSVPVTDAAPPFVELFPVDAIKHAALPTLMDGLVVNAAPPAPKLRGKRYVIELATTDLTALTEAIERFGPNKRLTLT